MVENPNNPILNLDVQKMQSWVAPAKLMYQGDKGYRQPFRLTNAWNEYDVKAENLCFSATKPDGQIIEVENEPERFTEQDNIWYFLLPDEITQKTGSVPCYFYVKDNINNIVASTTKFSYQVEAKFTDEERSVSYVSALERLQKKFEEYIENAKVSINQMTDSSNEVKQEAINRLNEARQQFESQLNLMINQFAEYQSKYNELLSTLNQKFDDELVSYQSDYDKWKDSALKDFEERIKTVTDELTAAEQNQADLKSAIDSAMDAVDKIKGVDFTKYALKEDLEKFYDKATIDEKLKNAGTLKQISVNGGTAVGPDDKGVANIDIDIPKPDLSNYETKEDANSSHNDLKTEINKRPVTVNNISPDDKGNIAIAIPDVSKMQQDITTLQNEMEEQKSKVAYHYADTLTDGQKYSTANPQILTGTP
ncbi:BppU family phage baseplate upper protein [Lactobacillus melliventris]|uniref:BppU family phage baseplate upper protein n=1 Tax=Lactobacillus melliventris TaxID=1218507 RepID=UPI001580F623|nr:BppU family phage baseplate upper protein [Lactobacillus melliventris]NUE98906.1 BppU family phage baseplate upper protein [Lactobacillus melliventris]